MSTSVPPPLRATRRVVLSSGGKASRRELFFRIVIAAVLVASMALSWWTFTDELVPAQKRSQVLTSNLSRLSTEVDELQRKWTRANADQIRKRYGNLQSQLFSDESALTAWLAHLRALAAPLALDVKVDFGKSVPQATADKSLTIIPTAISLEVHPQPGDNESPYQRLLRLSRELAAEGRRADLAELDVVGGPESVTRARFVFNLWAGEVQK